MLAVREELSVYPIYLICTERNITAFVWYIRATDTLTS